MSASLSPDSKRRSGEPTTVDGPEVERRVLGVALLYPQRIPDIHKALGAQNWFSKPSYAAIWMSIVRTWNEYEAHEDFAVLACRDYLYRTGSDSAISTFAALTTDVESNRLDEYISAIQEQPAA